MTADPREPEQPQTAAGRALTYAEDGIEGRERARRYALAIEAEAYDRGRLDAHAEYEPSAREARAQQVTADQERVEALLDRWEAEADIVETANVTGSGKRLPRTRRLIAAESIRACVNDLRAALTPAAQPERERVEALRLAYARLGQFGVHLVTCRARLSQTTGTCGCGLSAALAEGRALAPAAQPERERVETYEGPGDFAGLTRTAAGYTAANWDTLAAEAPRTPPGPPTVDDVERLRALQEWLLHPDRAYSPHEIAMYAYDEIAASFAPQRTGPQT